MYIFSSKMLKLPIAAQNWQDMANFTKNIPPFVILSQKSYDYLWKLKKSPISQLMPWFFIIIIPLEQWWNLTIFLSFYKHVIVWKRFWKWNHLHQKTFLLRIRIKRKKSYQNIFPQFFCYNHKLWSVFVQMSPFSAIILDFTLLLEKYTLNEHLNTL